MMFKDPNQFGIYDPRFYQQQQGQGAAYHQPQEGQWRAYQQQGAFGQPEGQWNAYQSPQQYYADHNGDNLG